MKLTRLRMRRERAFLTQEELAHRAGISRATLNAIERLRSDPEIATIRKIAAALGCEPADLIDPETS